MRERIFTKFGWPKKFISDNGSRFTAKAFVEFLKDNFVLHVLTPPYSPQCNSTERANRTVKTMIKIYLRDNQKKWDDQLPEIQFALNTAVQESTGFSPAEMNFGRNLKPPKSFFEDQTGNFSRHFNKKRSCWCPKIGELVYKKEFHLSKASEGFAAKLAPRYSGPFRVKTYISPSIVEIVDATDQLDRTYRVHLKDIKGVNTDDFSL